ESADRPRIGLPAVEWAPQSRFRRPKCVGHAVPRWFARRVPAHGPVPRTPHAIVRKSQMYSLVAFGCRETAQGTDTDDASSGMRTTGTDGAGAQGEEVMSTNGTNDTAGPSLEDIASLRAQVEEMRRQLAELAVSRHELAQQRAAVATMLADIQKLNAG